MKASRQTREVKCQKKVVKWTAANEQCKKGVKKIQLKGKDCSCKKVKAHLRIWKSISRKNKLSIKCNKISSRIRKCD